MKYCSTRNPSVTYTLSQALQQGLAHDSGLIVPQAWPNVSHLHQATDLGYPQFAAQLLTPFFDDDQLASSLPAICQYALNFSVPIKTLNDHAYILELFHGPTLSFKDVGARFLANCLARLTDDKPITVMVATSGDTGSAVAAAFHTQPNIRVVILFPEGKISTRQQQQITCWGDNVLAIAIDGTFDDCQKLVKSAFADPDWQQMTQLNTANSINIGRLLPQMTYYAYSSIQFHKQHDGPAHFIVPSGNVGNVTAAYWAKQLGFPIGDIILATNANTTIPDFLKSGDYQPRKSIETLANAMDVGNPSNFERLRQLFGSDQQLQQYLQAYSVSDSQIEAAILDCHQQYGVILCPHTATAYHVYKNFADKKPWILVATAHPSKFETIIEPLLKFEMAVPEHLQNLLDKKQHLYKSGTELSAISTRYRQYFIRS